MSVAINKRRMSAAPTDGTHVIVYGKHCDDCDEWHLGFCEVYMNGAHGWYNLLGYPSEPEWWVPLPDGYEQKTEPET